MRRSHVELRSSKEPAMQYVSETHDHKPSRGFYRPPTKTAEQLAKMHQDGDQPWEST